MELELSIPPQKAPVTPRVHASAEGEALPLEHFIRRLLDARSTAFVCLYGPPGAGKSTALADLAASMPPQTPLRLLDRPLIGNEGVSRSVLTIYTSHKAPADSDAGFRLSRWTRDHILEYLLATHRGRCRSVMSRLMAFPDGGASVGGSAELWRAVLDSMIADDSITTAAVALRRALSPLLSDPTLRTGRDCFDILLQ